MIRFYLQILSMILPLFIFTAQTSYAQTCSCAGAPLLGSQSAGASGAGNLLIGATYEFNQIADLYSGSTQLSERSVERNTQSALFEVNYGITDRFSVSGTSIFRILQLTTP
jgi:hypothetical protein